MLLQINDVLELNGLDTRINKIYIDVIADDMSVENVQKCLDRTLYVCKSMHYAEYKEHGICTDDFPNKYGLSLDEITTFMENCESYNAEDILAYAEVMYGFKFENITQTPDLYLDIY